MWYVYVINSMKSDFKYVGSTNNVKRRLEEHNKGLCISTKNYRPFKLSTYIAVGQKDKALYLERYFKSGSGGAFLKKHLL